MQYYIYNNLNSQNEYQKVFVDGILAADREIAIGKELFEIFTTFSSEPPVGALPLNGYEITGCISKLPEFWSQCIRRKENGTIPWVSSLSTYNQISGAQNGNCGYFYIQGDNNGTIKLPCLNTVVLTNNIDLNNSNELFGSYVSGDVGYHIHNNKFEFKINDTGSRTIQDSYYNITSGSYWVGGDSDGSRRQLLSGVSSGKTNYTFTTSYTNIAAGNIQCIPANIKVYYWIQVFSSYITQDSNGKLQVISNNSTSGYIESLDPIVESKLSNIVKDLLPTISSSIAAQISANVLSSLNIDLYYNTLANDIQTNKNNIHNLRNDLQILSTYIQNLNLNIPQDIIQNIQVLTSNVNTLSSNVNVLSTNVNTISASLNREIESIAIEPTSVLANFLTVDYNNSTKTRVLTTKQDMPTGIIKLTSPHINGYEIVTSNIDIDIDNNILQNIKTDIHSISTAMNNKIENIVVDDTKLLSNFIQIQKNNSTVTLSMPTYIPTGIIEITDNGKWNYNMYATKQCSAAISITENGY